MTLAEVADVLRMSDNIVFLGGAGVSTASGIPDFRSASGLYNQRAHSNYSPEYMLSRDFLADHPDEFYSYLRENLLYPDAKPNPAHTALTRLEAEGKLRAVITQNIDGLHQKAGSINVIELHGSLDDFNCTRCQRHYDLAWVLSRVGIPFCEACGSMVRPGVILYGESLREPVLTAAVQAITAADVLVVGGTSLVVYPAAGLVNYYRGSKLVVINRERTPYDSQADYAINGDISVVLADLAEHALT